LILDRHYSSEEDRIGQVEACNYIGHLKKDPEACVAMTGCVGLEDVEFTILSDHATESPMFKWTKEDTVEVIEHPYLVKNFEVFLSCFGDQIPNVNFFVCFSLNICNWKKTHTVFSKR
jgi:hypothetical protein